ncbi:MAG: ParB N-terminal domain-containing protein [Alphaproteobacteria bacterium]|nr:ParB N-terminal domain-containing protein [Alphaproteobacteria bacterium]
MTQVTPVRRRNRAAPGLPGATQVPSDPRSPSQEPDLCAQLSLIVEYRPASSLHPARRNARSHSKKQIQQIAASIREFGFVNPVLVDDQGRIVAGHGRVEAAKLLGQGTVPVIPLSHLTEEQKRAYVLADNRLAELSGWDRDLLKLELEELTSLDLSFEIEITGFDTAIIDQLSPGTAGASADKDDPEPEPSGPAVSRPGDLWHLGPHRILCGDARDGDAYRRLLGEDVAQMVFTDPPYNVPIDGHVSGLGRAQHREFAMASGEMSSEQFTAFLNTVLGQMAAVSAPGAIHFVCMDWRHMSELTAAGRAVYAELKNLCVWVKDNGGMGSFYRSQHELVFVYKVGTAAHINNFGLGEKGRYRTNVWGYPGLSSLRPGRDSALAVHPTVKPTALVMDAIKDCSRKGGLILDGFGGSGTTLIAAQRTGRHARLLEIDPLYVDVTIRRWQELTRGTAHHADTGESFEEVATRTETRAMLPAAGEVGHGKKG